MSRTDPPPRAPSQPARLAAYLAALLGLALLACGLWTFTVPRPPTVAVSIAVVGAGVLDLALAWFLLRGTRPAWAFAVSLNGTVFLVLLFGSFKVRDLAGIPLGLALVPALLFGAVTALLAVAHEDYEG